MDKPTDDGNFIMPGTYDRQLTQAKVQSERANKALRMVQKRRLSGGAQRIRKMIAQKNSTYADATSLIDQDDESLRWIPVVSPETRVEIELCGTADPGEPCYACQRGLGIERINNPTILKLRHLIHELFLSGMRTIECSLLIYDWFETNVRQRLNTLNIRGVPKIDEWSVAAITQHMRFHRSSPSYDQRSLLDMWRELAHFTFKNEIFRLPIEYWKPGEEIDYNQVRVNQRGVGMFERETRMIHQLYAWKLSSMYGHSQATSIQPQENTEHLLLSSSASVNYTKTVSVFEDINLDKW